MAALLFGFASFSLTWAKDRRQLFLTMHERMIEPDLQAGRRLVIYSVNSIDDVEAIQERSPDDYQLIVRAMAMADILGLYIRRKYISRSHAFYEWAHTLDKLAD